MAEPVKSPWSSVQRTAGQTHWQSLVTLSNVVTRKASYRTNSFVELGAGLNVPDTKGQFIAADPSFTITATGAEATGAAHQVFVPGDIGSGVGVRIITPKGGTLVFQPLAVDYFDPVDGRGVLLDTLTNAIGWLVASNEIIFSNCFTHIKASIRLRNTRAGLESDLILHERPPDPEAFGLSAFARLEMLTEQLEGVAPTRRATVLRGESNPALRADMVEPDFVDTELGFNGMKMAVGKAFITPTPTNAAAASMLPTRVGKTFLNLEGRNILIEAVEHRKVREALNRLPLITNSPQLRAGMPPAAPVGRLAVRTRALPVLARASRPADTAIQEARLVFSPNTSTGPDQKSLLASAAPAPAFVLDYYLLNEGGENNFTFRGDTTYLVSSFLLLTGTTTLEGGTVIKFNEGAGLIMFAGDSLICDTTNHLPAVFTCFNDHSIGENVGGSGAVVQVGAYAFYFIGGTRELNNVRFTHLSHPIAVEGSGTPSQITLRHVQVVNAAYALDTGNTTMKVFNGLFKDCGYVFSGTETAGTFLGEHLTVHNTTANPTTLGYATGATLKNSLLVAVQNPPGNITTYTDVATDKPTSPTGIFQSVEGGGYYLTNDTYRNSGDASIDDQLRAVITNMTTYAPEVLTGTLTTDRTLDRRAIRDTGGLDRGYHYPAVDYLAKNLTVQNATLKMRNGVVVAGGFNSSQPSPPALLLAPGKLISQGTATRPNHLLRASQIQENVQARGYSLLEDGQRQASVRPEITVRFTEISSLAGEGYNIFLYWDVRTIEFSHSTFSSGLAMNLYGGSLQNVGLTNNLFRRAPLSVSCNSDAKFNAYNNLLKDSALILYGDTVAWQIFDNVFDRTTLFEQVDQFGNKIVFDNNPDAMGYNAFVGIDHQLSTLNSSFFATSLAYASGPLGRYYVSGTTLQDAGSRTAGNAGLYHFTTLASLTSKEQGVVDIGLHYPSLAANGSPYDTDADGLADYLEDSSGNGAVETADLASFNLWDTDNDGMPDGQEFEGGNNPRSPECPRAIYEAVLEGQIPTQSPSAWFKLNHESGDGLANAKIGSGLANVGGVWDADAFGNGNGAFSFTANVNSERLIPVDPITLQPVDVISGGDGSSKGSISLLFRALTGVTTAKRYLFCQKGSGEFGVFFEDHVSPGGLKVEISGQTVTILPSPVIFGAWYYLAITWDENRLDANGAEVTWHLGPIGGTLTSGTINLTDTAVVGNSSAVFLGNRQNNNLSFTSAFRSPGSGALDEIAFWSRELSYVDDILPQFNTLNTLFQGPSKVIDLSRWELTLPVDNLNQLDNTHQPLDISKAVLNAGFKYVNPLSGGCTKNYFYRDDTKMVFEVPFNGADQDNNSPATSLGSPRSELRGTLANGNEDNWQPVGTHILEGTCNVNAQNLVSGKKVIIGQIHEKTPTSVASIVVNYNFPNPQDVSVTVKDRADGTDNPLFDPGQPDRNIILATGVPLGATFKYTLELVGTATSLTLNATYNDGTVRTRPMYQSGDPIWNDATWLTSFFYFKAGCYFPKAAANSSAKVTFSTLSATHQP